MNTLNERIKKLRKGLDLTQQEFADKLSIKRNTVATYETGKSNPSDAAVILICKTFNVSETWLRTGEGEMFAPEPAFDLGEYANRHGMTALETAILKAYLDLDPSVRESLLRHFKERLARPAAPAVISKTETTTPAPTFAPAHTPTIEEEARAEAEQHARQIYEQILAEKKAAAGMSSESSGPPVGGGTAKRA